MTQCDWCKQYFDEFWKCLKSRMQEKADCEDCKYLNKKGDQYYCKYCAYDEYLEKEFHGRLVPHEDCEEGKEEPNIKEEDGYYLLH